MLELSEAACERIRDGFDAYYEKLSKTEREALLGEPGKAADAISAKLDSEAASHKGMHFLDRGAKGWQKATTEQEKDAAQWYWDLGECLISRALQKARAGK